MRLCVGAASRRVVEEAANLRVAQVVASRRQAGETAPGYTGYTSATLAETVRKLSGGATQAVRDHGGPYQNGDPHDDWTAALDADAGAGLDVLHLDVSNLPRNEQHAELARLCKRYDGRAGIEVGGERDSQDWLNTLLKSALEACQPDAAVAAFGGRIWADRQCGSLASASRAAEITAFYARSGVLAKAHNMDWAGGRQAYLLDGLYNVAPELGNVEIDAWLRVLPHDHGAALLRRAYETGAWQRWFGPGQGTFFERSRAALRYHLESPWCAAVLDRYDDGPVREAIRDAVTAG